MSKRDLLILLIIVSFSILLVYFINFVFVKHYEFYAYGDSITKATGYTDLPKDGSGSYIYFIRNRIDKSAKADHNMDGGGKTSDWGWKNIDTHVNHSQNTSVIVFMFGVND